MLPRQAAVEARVAAGVGARTRAGAVGDVRVALRVARLMARYRHRPPPEHLRREYEGLGGETKIRKTDN